MYMVAKNETINKWLFGGDVFDTDMIVQFSTLSLSTVFKLVTFC